jgi:hypothetical protein
VISYLLLERLFNLIYLPKDLLHLLYLLVTLLQLADKHFVILNLCFDLLFELDYLICLRSIQLSVSIILQLQLL